MAIGGKIGSGAARLFKGEVPSVAFGNHIQLLSWPLWPLVGKSARPFKGEVPSVAFGNHIIAVLGLAGHCGHWWENRLRRGKAFQGAIRRFRKPYNWLSWAWLAIRKPYNCCSGPGHCGYWWENRLRRGEAFQGRGAIRRFRKPYNCCPGPGWPLWPLVGKSAQARRGAVRRFRKSYIIAVLGLAGHCGHWWENRRRRGEAFQGRGAIRRFRKPYNCCPGPGECGHWWENRLRRGEAFQGRGAIRRFRKPYNCCPGPGWPSWPLVGKSAEATVAIGGKIGSGAARPFKGEVPSVAFGNHIIAVLGLAGHCGHWWENRLRRGEAFQGRGAIRRFRKSYIIAVLGLAGHCGHWWTVLGLAGHCGHWSENRLRLQGRGAIRQF